MKKVEVESLKPVLETFFTFWAQEVGGAGVLCARECYFQKEARRFGVIYSINLV